MLITFALGGLWHGANWTFVAWGVLNGVGVIVVQMMARAGWSLPRGAAWALTVVFTIVAWVFFRASNLGDALHVVAVMFGARGAGINTAIAEWAPLFNSATYTRTGIDMHLAALWTGAIMVGGFAIAWYAPNSQALLLRWRWSARLGVLVALLAIAALLNLDRVTEFLYFNF